MSKELLLDLAKVKAVFQQRAIVSILTEGAPQTSQVVCDTCGRDADTLNEAFQCEYCAQEYMANEFQHLRPLYDFEVATGIHVPNVGEA